MNSSELHHKFAAQEPSKLISVLRVEFKKYLFPLPQIAESIFEL